MRQILVTNGLRGQPLPPPTPECKKKNKHNNKSPREKLGTASTGVVEGVRKITLIDGVAWQESLTTPTKYCCFIGIFVFNLYRLNESCRTRVVRRSVFYKGNEKKKKIEHHIHTFYCLPVNTSNNITRIQHNSVLYE